MGGQTELTGPDLVRGVPLSDIPDGGMLAGHAHGQAVLLARRGDDVFAVGSACTHYGGPLAEGLLVDDTVRCPWHHACYSLHTGEAVGAPALTPIPRFSVERRGAKIFVGEEAPSAARPTRPDGAPATVVIVGAGAAGDAAADMLRRRGYEGAITLVGADESAPYDRPNLSKDYLAGNAPEEWIPLRPPSFYADRKIHVTFGTRVTAIDRKARTVTLSNGGTIAYGVLLLATGATPARLPKAIDPMDRVRYLRTLADSRALIAAAEKSKRAVVLGASFIGLEVAASLRARGLEVHVVAPEAKPLERVMGPQLADMIRVEHESHEVKFHLGATAKVIDDTGVTLDNGERLAADLVVAGIGVRPNEELAAQAGLTVDKGVVVDEYLRTSDPAIFAAGDIARYPDPNTGGRIRVEHWVAAQRQGQAAARNILMGTSGKLAPFADVPFFWSKHYDITINYVGHAEHWDAIDVDGSIAKHDCTVTFRERGKALAVVTVGRDRASLEAEVALEREHAHVH